MALGLALEAVEKPVREEQEGDQGKQKQNANEVGGARLLLRRRPRYPEDIDKDTDERFHRMHDVYQSAPRQLSMQPP